MTETTEHPTGEWTYVGVALTHDGKGAHKWIDHEGTPRLFGGKNLTRHAPIGGVYEVTFSVGENGGLSAFLDGEKAPRYLRPHEDKEQVSLWRLDHDTNTTIMDADKAASKAYKYNAMEDMTLAQFRDAYSNALPSRKRAMLAVLYNFVTS